MAQVYDSVDLFWTSKGDICIGGDGDILDTEFDPLRSFIQEVRTRCESDQGDWKNFPEIGATLSDFVGEANQPVVAETIKTRIISALAKDGFIHTKDMKIQYLPLDIDTILMRISFQVAPTAKNASTEVLIHNMLYSYSDNNVYFVR